MPGRGGICRGHSQMHLHAVGEKTASILDPVGRVAVPQGDPGPNRVRQLQALEQMIQRRSWQHRFLVAITRTSRSSTTRRVLPAAVESRPSRLAPSVARRGGRRDRIPGQAGRLRPQAELTLNLWYPHFERTAPQEQGGAAVVRTPAAIRWDVIPIGFSISRCCRPECCIGSTTCTKDLPLGDRAILYPGQQGLIGSLRFSAIIAHGLQDFEYLWMLEDRLRTIKQQTGQDAFWLDPRQRPLELCLRRHLVIPRLHARSRMCCWKCAVRWRKRSSRSPRRRG